MMSRRYLLLIIPLLLLLYSLYHLSADEQHQHLSQLTQLAPSTLWGGKVEPERWVPASRGALVDFGPKDSLRTNLNQSMRYATTFMSAGWNNEVMTVFQLLHILTLLREDHSPQLFVPLLPPFTPHAGHIGAPGSSNTWYLPTLAFGRVFDVPRLAAELNTPIVEMHELKREKPCCGHLPKEQQEEAEGWWVRNGRDDLSCWSSDMTRDRRLAKGAGWEATEDIYGLNIIWTPLPPYIHAPDPNSAFLIYQWLRTFLVPANPGTNKLRHDWLAPPYTYAQRMLDAWAGDAKWAKEQGLGKGGKVEVEKVFGVGKEGWRVPEMERDGDILCMDGLYWGSDRGGMPFQSDSEDGPAVTIVPKAHFTREVLDMSWATVRRALGIAEGLDGKGVPDLITIHIRRGDFLQDCDHNPLREPCLMVKHFAKKVEIVREGLRAKGVEETQVLVMTNEKDPGYLAELREMGWVVVDHEELRTAEHYGDWFPTILDSAILTFGVGIVGTASSTMSILAFQRMAVWNPIFVSAYLGRFEAEYL